MVATAAPKVRLSLYDEQAAFVLDPARYPAFIAGRNSGKTVAGAIKAANRCAEPGLGVVAAPAFPMLEHAAKRALLHELNRRAEADPRWAYVEHKSTRTLIIPATGAEVLFGSLDNPDSVRGPNFAWGWLDEPGYVGEDGWRVLKGGVRDGPHPQLWTTGTPKGRAHWLYQEWMIEPSADHTFHHATSQMNPFADPTYVSALGYSGSFYDQEIGGEFVAFEGLVYPGFSRKQVIAVDCTGWASCIAVDVGTRNPTAILTLRHASDRIHVEREVYRRGMGSTEIVDEVTDAYHAAHADFAVADPSAAGLITDAKKRGLSTRKGNNAIVTGITRVTTAMPSLTIDPSCVNLIAELESYCYADGGKADKDTPVKANDHAADALRYGIMELVTAVTAVAASGITQRSQWR